MITAQQVKELREKTQASMADCKKALEEAGGDFEKALQILQRRGKQLAAKRAERQTKQGIIEAYIHSNKKIGAILGLNCETDFVAKNELFKELAHELVMHVAAMNPQYGTPGDIPEDVLSQQKENYLEEFNGSGKPKNVIDQIIEGKINKFIEEICLLEQPFIRDPEKKVKDLVDEYIAKIGENIKVGKFSRLEI